MATVRSMLKSSSDISAGPAPTRYRCDVVAPTALDVVSGMGGRLVDLAMAGWEVTAVLADCSDTRPLRVLGAAVVDLGRFLTSPDRDRIPQVLTVAGDMWGSDERVRREVHIALDELRTEVAVRGCASAIGLDARALSPTRHRISAAGRAFKAKALIAAGRSPVFEPTESYWTTAAAESHIHVCI